MNAKSAWMGMGVLLLFLIAGTAMPVMAEKTINLRFSSFVPAGHFMNSKIFQPWIDMVEKKTDGKVQIKLYTGSALGKPQDQFDMAARGVADLTWGILAYTAGRFPLTTVMELPFMSPSSEIGSRIVWRLYKEGHIASEFNAVKMLGLGMPPNMDIHVNKKQVKTLDDLKGMKIRTPSAMMGQLIKKWGGVPVAMPAQEVYLSLERGVMDAVFFDPLTLFGLRCNEVTKYHTKVGISTTVMFFAMNQKKFDELPADVRKVIDDLTGEWWTADYHGKIADQMAAGAWRELGASGGIMYGLPPVELARWEASAAPAFEEWVADAEAKGLPGKEVLKAALRLKAELTAE